MPQRSSADGIGNANTMRRGLSPGFCSTLTYIQREVLLMAPMVTINTPSKNGNQAHRNQKPYPELSIAEYIHQAPSTVNTNPIDRGINHNRRKRLTLLVNSGSGCGFGGTS